MQACKGQCDSRNIEKARRVAVGIYGLHWSRKPSVFFRVVRMHWEEGVGGLHMEGYPGNRRWCSEQLDAVACTARQCESGQSHHHPPLWLRVQDIAPQIPESSCTSKIKPTVIIITKHKKCKNYYY